MLLQSLDLKSFCYSEKVKVNVAPGFWEGQLAPKGGIFSNLSGV